MKDIKTKEDIIRYSIRCMLRGIKDGLYDIPFKYTDAFLFFRYDSPSVFKDNIPLYIKLVRE